MNIIALKHAVESGKIEWQRHALERMLQRGLSRQMVKDALLAGEMIEDCPDDVPFPSALFLGWPASNPLHVVAALDTNDNIAYIITVYKPDLEHFMDDYRSRRKHGN